jgi:hypothetical protein
MVYELNTHSFFLLCFFSFCGSEIKVSRQHVLWGPQFYSCLSNLIWILGKSGHAQNLLPVRATSGQGFFQSRDFVTSDQKALLGRILCNFRLRMRRIYFRIGSLPVMWLTSLPVMWLTPLPVTWLPVAPPQMWLCLCPSLGSVLGCSLRRPRPIALGNPASYI